MKTVESEPRYSLQEAADQLGMGKRCLFAALRRRRILDHHNVPRSRYKRAGYLVEHEASYKHPVVGVRFYSRAYVTPAGLAWLRDELVGSATDQRARMHALVQQVARMNPEAGEIGPSKLHHLVSQARDILAHNEAHS